ncbi:hypothetical protein SLOPH_2326 [Spraguea lophii 42_110]|uniref:cDENN domain-containing protein n=1 Tax=Spraguea lophii (strain 42_110) TaxID=1358809 RepID=S7W563_SPRLO|nr:hypothetical protein SLOPH_2326 [Spraguea lophii 42_110]
MIIKIFFSYHFISVSCFLPFMQISGYFKYKSTKLLVKDKYPISHMKVHPVNKQIPNDYYLLVNNNNKVCVFDNTESYNVLNKNIKDRNISNKNIDDRNIINDISSEKYYIIYTTGKHPQNYILYATNISEINRNINKDVICIDNKKYILKKKGSKKFHSVTIRNNKLVFYNRVSDDEKQDIQEESNKKILSDNKLEENDNKMKDKNNIYNDIKYNLISSNTIIPDIIPLVSSTINSFDSYRIGEIQKVLFSYKDTSVYSLVILFLEEIHVLLLHADKYTDNIENWIIKFSEIESKIDMNIFLETIRIDNKILLSIDNKDDGKDNKCNNNFVNGDDSNNDNNKNNNTNNNTNNNIILKYELSNYNYESYQSTFIIELLNSVLLEKRIIIYSSSNNKIFNILVCILKIINPFKYKNTIISRISKETEILVESPFPYILCYVMEEDKSKDKSNIFNRLRKSKNKENGKHNHNYKYFDRIMANKYNDNIVIIDLDGGRVFMNENKDDEEEEVYNESYKDGARVKIYQDDDKNIKHGNIDKRNGINESVEVKEGKPINNNAEGQVNDEKHKTINKSDNDNRDCKINEENKFKDNDINEHNKDNTKSDDCNNNKDNTKSDDCNNNEDNIRSKNNNNSRDNNNENNNKSTNNETNTKETIPKTDKKNKIKITKHKKNKSIYTTNKKNHYIELLFEEGLIEKYNKSNDKIKILKNYISMLTSVINRRLEEKILIILKKNNKNKLTKILYNIEDALKDKEQWFKEFNKTSMYKEYVITNEYTDKSNIITKKEDVNNYRKYYLVKEDKIDNNIENIFIKKIGDYNLYINYIEEEYKYIDILELYLYLYNGPLQHLIERLLKEYKNNNNEDNNGENSNRRDTINNNKNENTIKDNNNNDDTINDNNNNENTINDNNNNENTMRDNNNNHMKDNFKLIIPYIFKYYSERELYDEIIEFKRLIDNLEIKMKDDMLLNIKYYKDRKRVFFDELQDIECKVEVEDNIFTVYKIYDCSSSDTDNDNCNEEYDIILKSRIMGPKMILKLLKVNDNRGIEYFIENYPVLYFSIIILLKRYGLFNSFE